MCTRLGIEAVDADDEIQGVGDVDVMRADGDRRPDDAVGLALERAGGVDHQPRIVTAQHRRIDSLAVEHHGRDRRIAERAGRSPPRVPIERPATMTCQRFFAAKSRTIRPPNVP